MNEKKMLSKMIALAAVKHEGQFDRGGLPYILHPLALLSMLDAEESADEELQCIVVGHDLIEDTDTTYKELSALGFSQRVIDGIKSVTKIPGESYEEYREKVFSSVDGMRVKKVDLRHNSDLTRLKGVRQKDLDRAARYSQFYFDICVRQLSPEVTE